jgi:hypothetical protein
MLMVLSFDQAPTVWLELETLLGGEGWEAAYRRVNNVVHELVVPARS